MLIGLRLGISDVFFLPVNLMFFLYNHVRNIARERETLFGIWSGFLYGLGVIIYRSIGSRTSFVVCRFGLSRKRDREDSSYG